MKIFCIGDIVSKPGRKVVQHFLPKLREEHGIDFVIANGENLAHGSGMTVKTMNQALESGIDLFTSGDHIFKHEKFYEELDKKDSLVIRPCNYPEGVPGKGYKHIKTPAGNILVINAIGFTFMKGNFLNPFEAIETLLKKQKKYKYEAIIVDFHAEATSEKYMMRHYFDGKVSLIFGTHTHVPTADAHITSKHTGFISDLGMTGAVDSSLGDIPECRIKRLLTNLPAKRELAENYPYYLRGVLCEFSKGKCKSIELLQLKLDEKNG